MYRIKIIVEDSKGNVFYSDYGAWANSLDSMRTAYLKLLSLAEGTTEKEFKEKFKSIWADKGGL